jgi:hypothetical protein
MITRESLLKQRDDIVRQRDNAFAVHQQAVGALTLIDHLISVADQSEKGMPLEEFQKAVGADSAEIVKVEDR